MAVTVLDLITGAVRPLSQLIGIAANIMTFEMQAGGTRSLAAILAQPDTLKLFDMTSRAQLTYNQALAADGGGGASVFGSGVWNDTATWNDADIWKDAA